MRSGQGTSCHVKGVPILCQQLYTACPSAACSVVKRSAVICVSIKHLKLDTLVLNESWLECLVVLL